MKRLVMVLFLMLAFSIAMKAQKRIVEVESCEVDALDLEAKLNPFNDANGKPGSLIRLSTHFRNVTFDGNIIGSPEFVNGEWLLRMPAGSRILFIHVDGYAPIDYLFPSPLEAYYTYRMVVSEPAIEQFRLFVVPLLGMSSSHMSYGIMTGIVRRFGVYVKGKSDFSQIPSPTLSCGAEGLIDGHKGWFTGKSEKLRYSATLGPIVRVLNNFYLYSGAGYGVRVLEWEMYDGCYAEVTPFTSRGLELELGAMLTFGKVSIVSGLSICGARYMDADLGVGLCF